MNAILAAGGLQLPPHPQLAEALAAPDTDRLHKTSYASALMKI